MPTRDDMDRVTNSIEVLILSLDVVCLEGDRVIPASPDCGSGYFFWGDLSQTQKQAALSVAIDWEGFSEDQQWDVIKRVLDGEEPDMWMEGLDALRTPQEFKALVAEMRDEELAARVLNYGEADAAAFEQRVKDGADTVQHLEPEVPAALPITEAELTEIERSWATPQSQFQSIIRGGDYDQFLSNATEKALSRMQGDGGGHER